MMLCFAVGKLLLTDRTHTAVPQGKVLRSQAYNDDTLIVNLMTASASFAWEPVLRARYTFAQSAAIH